MQRFEDAMVADPSMYAQWIDVQSFVDHGIVARVEIVVAKAAVAGHVDAEDEQVALSFEIGVDDGFGEIVFTVSSLSVAL